MLINVTAEDIKKGRRSAACSCPIAIAALRAGLPHPEVDNDTIDYAEPGHISRALPLPFVAREFIEKFDGGLDVEPFEFELVVT